MLRAVIWKDIRVNRLPLTLAAALVIASYAVVAIMANVDPSSAAEPWQRRAVAVIFIGSMTSHGLSQLALAVLSGNLFAAERVDRSAEFLVYLPASRGIVLRAKAALLAAVAFGLLLLHIGGMQLGLIFGELPPPDTSLFTMVGGISAVGFCGAGIGWLASCYIAHMN